MEAFARSNFIPGSGVVGVGTGWKIRELHLDLAKMSPIVRALALPFPDAVALGAVRALD